MTKIINPKCPNNSLKSKRMPPQKIIHSTAAMGALWAVAASLLFLHFGLGSESRVLSTVLFAAGILVWSGVWAAFPKKDLRTIEPHGVYPYPAPISPRKLAILIALSIVASAAALSLAYAYSYFPLWTFTLNFLFPALPALYLTATLRYWRWQRRNKRTLYSADGKLYPYPYLNVEAGNGKTT